MKKKNFIELRFKKSEEQYCAEHGRKKFLVDYLKHCKDILFMLLISLPSSLISLSLALFVGYGSFGYAEKMIRTLWYVGGGMFGFISLFLSIILLTQRKRIKVFKTELSKLKDQSDKTGKI